MEKEKMPTPKNDVSWVNAESTSLNWVIKNAAVTDRKGFHDPATELGALTIKFFSCIRSHIFIMGKLGGSVSNTNPSNDGKELKPLWYCVCIGLNACVRPWMLLAVALDPLWPISHNGPKSTYENNLELTFLPMQTKDLI